MKVFLFEAVRSDPRQDRRSSCWTAIFKVLQERYNSMRNAVTVVVSSTTMKRNAYVSFFYELGMSGITSVLLVWSFSSFWIYICSNLFSCANFQSI
ncbi:hypothetical protein IFM89_036857 [Coptis chinensis]|uniref:Uncharacterized protein n=1 Tax=Coptis chinensis TaxID=261450 RepID=A0A835HGN5_9MAGN|nr:hypothetical protein IFM89_036857 [Coptis chinensis]